MSWFPRHVLLVLVSLALASCGGSSSSSDEADVPVGTPDAGGVDGPLAIAFVSPELGHTVMPGSTVDLIADVTWAGRHTDIRVKWYSDQAGFLGETKPDTGYRASLLRVELEPGTHRLQAKAEEIDGEASAEDDVTIVVLERPGAPEVHIAPQEPTTRDDLEVVIDKPSGGALADEVVYTYRWERDGELEGGLTDASVPFSATSKGERWRVSVTPTVYGYEGEAATTSVTILNSLPVAASVEIFPTLVTTTSELTCHVSGIDDADGDNVVVLTAWTINDTLLVGATEDHLPASETSRGDRIRCQVKPFDSEEYGAELVSDEVVVQNTAPALDSVSITPDEGHSGTVFTCAAHAPQDDDGDEIALQWSWRVDGALVEGAESATFAATGLARGQVVSCGVVPSDGSDDGRLYESAGVALGNSPPTLTTVLLSPLGPTVLDELSCRALDAADLDGDEIQLVIAWYVNDTLQVGATADTFSSGAAQGSPPKFTKGDYVSCEITPFDGHAQGPAIRSKDRALVVNSAPSIPLVEISPAEGDMFTEFRCEPRGWEDPDLDDPQEVSYRWLRNGIAVPGETDEAYGGLLAPSDLLVCEATPSDTEDTGLPVLSAEVRVVNEPPTMDSASLAPTSPTAADTLACTGYGWSDLEGAPATYHFSWLVNGLPVADEDDATLSGRFGKGDVVMCVVRPFDGFQEGDAVYSNPVTVVNLPPRIVALQLVPGHGNHRTEFRCEPVEVEDLDGDTLTFSYRWTINGTGMEEDGPTVSGIVFTNGDLLRCAASPSDGLADGPWVESNVATLFNAPPSVASVRVEPDGATAAVGLWCVAEGWSDADGDPESYRFQWLVNGQPLDGAVSSALAPGPYAKGDEVVCRVTPWGRLRRGQPAQLVAPRHREHAADARSGDARRHLAGRQPHLRVPPERRERPGRRLRVVPLPLVPQRRGDPGRGERHAVGRVLRGQRHRAVRGHPRRRRRPGRARAVQRPESGEHAADRRDPRAVGRGDRFGDVHPLRRPRGG